MLRPLPYSVYLPPCGERVVGGGVPTVYLLHGLGGDDRQWLDFGLAATADQLIRRGELPPFAVVLPWHRAGIELEPAIVEVLVPHIEANYRMRRGRGWRAIGGLSRGGGWALHIGLSHPRAFSAIGMHSPAVRSGDMSRLRGWIESTPAPLLPRLWIDIGDRDGLRGSAGELEAALRAYGLQPAFQIGEGGHDAEYWSANLEAYLRWYGQGW